jgi:hypothetical protein
MMKKFSTIFYFVFNPLIIIWFYFPCLAISTPLTEDFLQSTKQDTKLSSSPFKKKKKSSLEERKALEEKKALKKSKKKNPHILNFIWKTFIITTSALLFVGGSTFFFNRLKPKITIQHELGDDSKKKLYSFGETIHTGLTTLGTDSKESIQDINEKLKNIGTNIQHWFREEFQVDTEKRLEQLEQIIGKALYSTVSVHNLTEPLQTLISETLTKSIKSPSGQYVPQTTSTKLTFKDAIQLLEHTKGIFGSLTPEAQDKIHDNYQQLINSLNYLKQELEQNGDIPPEEFQNCYDLATQFLSAIQKPDLKQTLNPYLFSMKTTDMIKKTAHAVGPLCERTDKLIEVMSKGIEVIGKGIGIKPQLW